MRMTGQIAVRLQWTEFVMGDGLWVIGGEGGPRAASSIWSYTAPS